MGTEHMDGGVLCVADFILQISDFHLLKPKRDLTRLCIEGMRHISFSLNPLYSRKWFN
jgi:hypothetical protein